MAIITELAENKSRKEADFDPLIDYKKEFFDRNLDLLTAVTETRQRCICREDTQADWMEISARLELLHHHVHAKIIPKMEV